MFHFYISAILLLIKMEGFRQFFFYMFILSGHREQLNRLTAFIDGSQIYGSDDNLALELRSLVNGTLKAGVGHLLPHEDRQDTLLYSECLNHDECFKAGELL